MKIYLFSDRQITLIDSRDELYPQRWAGGEDEVHDSVPSRPALDRRYQGADGRQGFTKVARRAGEKACKVLWLEEVTEGAVIER